MLRSALLLTIALVVSLLSQHAASQAVYSKTVEVPALRISYTDLQNLLEKAASLMRSANANGKSSIREEEVELREGELRVKLPGHRVIGTDAQLPKTVDEVTYSIVARGEAAVTSIRMDFYDFRRTLRVDGSSPEQVDAVFAALRDDLLRLSSTLGGSGVTFFVQLMLPILLGAVALNFLLYWVQYRTRQYGIPFFVASACVTLLLALPTKRLLAGFVVVEGDPSFLVRYGPEISFIGLVVGIAAIPFSYVLSRSWSQEKDESSPNSAVQETRRKRRAPDRGR